MTERATNRTGTSVDFQNSGSFEPRAARWRTPVATESMRESGYLDFDWP